MQDRVNQSKPPGNISSRPCGSEPDRYRDRYDFHCTDKSPVGRVVVTEEFDGQKDSCQCEQCQRHASMKSAQFGLQPRIQSAFDSSASIRIRATALHRTRVTGMCGSSINDHIPLVVGFGPQEFLIVWTHPKVKLRIKAEPG